ncbi:hypothetical protein NDU88_003612 [Pleurodeles waltl]|uniref:Uncharacterized protein n=1 Tax=Pleurodeles waltl TaxID=8319 RepID=A0AAV7KX03_PLEWA|nr:hypothetical protein NDU88_003612 [Pleurodeles waltl]
MMELCAGFQAIDTRFNALGACLDQIDERLDRHATRLDGEEHRLSGLKDGSAQSLKRLEKVEQMLKVFVDKN